MPRWPEENYISLALLIQEKVLASGPHLSVTAYGETHEAVLLETGSIRFRGRDFASPSSFSLYVKQIYNPTKKADDGWKSVCYDSRPLEEFRKEYRVRNGHADQPKKRVKKQLKAKKAKTRKRRSRLEDSPATLFTSSGPSDESNKMNNHSNGMGVSSRSEVGSDASLHSLAAAPQSSQDNSDEVTLRLEPMKKRGKLIHESSEPRFTWWSCKLCRKWRRVAQSIVADTVHEHAFVCHMNPDERYNKCACPQEVGSDVHHVRSTLSRQSSEVFLAFSSRPPLEHSTPEEFYYDLAEFLQHVEGQKDRADEIRDRAFSGDLFSLYKAVVRGGGLNISCGQMDLKSFRVLKIILESNEIEFPRGDAAAARQFTRYLSAYERVWFKWDSSYHEMEMEDSPAAGISESCGRFAAAPGTNNMHVNDDVIQQSSSITPHQKMTPVNIN